MQASDCRGPGQAGLSPGQVSPGSGHSPQNGHTEPQATQVQPQAEPVSTLPEAPASANVHVTMAGRTVQVTLRDSDEQRLLARLEALLQRFPAEEEPRGEQASPEGWCNKHGVQMKLRNGAHGAWWSHKTPRVGARASRGNREGRVLPALPILTLLRMGV